jgi:hypothetical protein
MDQPAVVAPLRLSLVVQQLGWLGEIVAWRMAVGAGWQAVGPTTRISGAETTPFLPRVPCPPPGSRSRSRSDAGTASHLNFVSFGG